MDTCTVKMHRTICVLTMSNPDVALCSAWATVSSDEQQMLVDSSSPLFIIFSIGPVSSIPVIN